MILNIFTIIFGFVCAAYDFILIFLNPGTLLDNVFSFTHIWLIFGGYHIFVGIYRLCKKHSFISIWKKWLKILVLSLCGAGLIISAVNLGFILTPQTVSMSEPCDYVILLGGGIDKDGKLPASVQTRVEKTAEYLKLHPDCVCVVTGGTLKWLPYPEAPEIKRQLVARGISEEKILVEDKARDTIQNFQYSVLILEKYTGFSAGEILDKKFVVVTSRFHLRRAERLAKRMGFKKIKGISAKCPPIYIVHDYVREICAYIKLNMRILLTGKPEPLL